ncbi:MAG: sulfur carrier protein ThiS adenylyltransferase ThiF, partial [Thermoguttaceae bacterium]|nr:sulfur carrier protein ThiS adenylyltransferase ThiF [Thermoguttaceae bacterium]
MNDAQRAILERAKIGVAGLGGLGSNVLSHLVRAGIRRFVSADFDVVSASNLNRQFFFADQVGQKKTVALAENLCRIDPELELDFRDLRLTEENTQDLFADCDVVVEAFDKADAKTMLIGALADSGIPVVAASGLAGFGKSNDIRVRKAGKNLYLVGDLVDHGGVDAGVGGDHLVPAERGRVALECGLNVRGEIFADLGDRGEEGPHDLFASFLHHLIGSVAEFFGEEPERLGDLLRQQFPDLLEQLPGIEADVV